MWRSREGHLRAVVAVVIAAICLGSQAQRRALAEGLMGRAELLQEEIRAALGTTPEQKDMLRKVAGESKVVVCTLVSEANKGSVQEWLAGVDKAGLGAQVLLLAESAQAFVDVQRMAPDHALLVDRSPSATQDQSFHLRTKPEYILALLELDITVLYADVTLRLKADPFPYFPGTFQALLQEDPGVFNGSLERFKGGKPARPLVSGGVMHQVGEALFLVRPAEESKALMQMWHDSIQEAAQWTPGSANAHLSDALRRMAGGSSVGILPPQLFPLQCIYAGRPDLPQHPCNLEHKLFLKARKPSPVVIPGSGSVAAQGVEAQATTGAQETRSPCADSKQVSVIGLDSPLPELPVNATDEFSVEYVAQNIARNNNQDRFVILVATDGGFFDFLENWYSTVEKLGHGSKVLFVAEDHVAFDYLHGKWPKQTAFVFRDTALEDDHGGRTIGSQYFVTIVSRRPRYILPLLDLNFTVLFSDVDMVWLKDPFPFFQGTDFDAIFQADEFRFNEDAFPNGSFGHFKSFPSQVCTCFSLFRPTEPAKDLLRLWLRLMLIKPTEVDQWLFNDILKIVDERIITIKMFPSQFFPSGCMYFGGENFGCYETKAKYDAAVAAGRAEPFVVHNNFGIVGHGDKLNRFKNASLWFV